MKDMQVLESLKTILPSLWINGSLNNNEQTKFNFINKLYNLGELIRHLVHKNQELDKWLPEDTANIQMNEEDWINFKEQQRLFKTISRRLLRDFTAATGANTPNVDASVLNKYLSEARQLTEIFEEEYSDLDKKIASIDQRYSPQFSEDIAAQQSPVNEESLAKAKKRLLDIDSSDFEDPAVYRQFKLVIDDYIGTIKYINAINNDYEAWLLNKAPTMEQWHTRLHKYRDIKTIELRMIDGQRLFNNVLTKQWTAENAVKAHLIWDELNVFATETFEKLLPLEQQIKEQITDVFGNFPISFAPETLESLRSLQAIRKLVAEQEALEEHPDINEILGTILRDTSIYIEDISKNANSKASWMNSIPLLKSDLTQGIDALEEACEAADNNPLENTSIVSDLKALIDNLNTQVDRIKELKLAELEPEDEPDFSWDPVTVVVDDKEPYSADQQIPQSAPSVDPKTSLKDSYTERLYVNITENIPSYVAYDFIVKALIKLEVSISVYIQAIFALADLVNDSFESPELQDRIVTKQEEIRKTFKELEEGASQLAEDNPLQHTTVLSDIKQLIDDLNNEASKLSDSSTQLTSPSSEPLPAQNSIPRSESFDTASRHSSSSSSDSSSETSEEEPMKEHVDTIKNDFKTAKSASDLRKLLDKTTNARYKDTLRDAIKIFELTASLEEKINEIEPEDMGLQSNATALITQINENVSTLMAKGIDNFNQTNVRECMNAIATTIDEKKDQFEPAWWHSIADLLIQFFNGLKKLANSLGADTTRTGLFSERTGDGEKFNQVLKELKSDAAGFTGNAQP